MRRKPEPEYLPPVNPSAHPTVPLPEPVMMTAVCSMCGADWQEHPYSPTAIDCVVLLRGKLVDAQTELGSCRAQLRKRT